VKMQATVGLAIAGADVHFIGFLFAVHQQFRAENSLMNFCTYSVL